MAHQATELQNQAEIIRKLEDAYKESSALIASKDEEISSLSSKKVEEVDQFKSSLSESESKVLDLNQQIESISVKVTELKLENDTQTDLLNHQQTLISNQAEEIAKVTLENETQNSHINEQNQLIEQFKTSNKTHED